RYGVRGGRAGRPAGQDGHQDEQVAGQGRSGGGVFHERFSQRRSAGEAAGRTQSYAGAGRRASHSPESSPVSADVERGGGSFRRRLSVQGKSPPPPVLAGGGPAVDRLDAAFWVVTVCSAPRLSQAETLGAVAAAVSLGAALGLRETDREPLR